ncbi:hypothetical protein QCA50_001960 [Cerrena zonata]|uniref:Uncharacterized protein n=1 Tax=Cerrena zonata TaxID=2478898 RepID=A0AAW0GS75_9APHY
MSTAPGHNPARASTSTVQANGHAGSSTEAFNQAQLFAGHTGTSRGCLDARTEPPRFQYTRDECQYQSLHDPVFFTT